MSSQTWTAAQQQAISERGSNLLVAAGAGAGKTAVLVERIIRRVTDQDNPLNIDQLLVVTFTNAAAAEMRERISAAIAGKLAENPGDAHLTRQLALLGRASIATLHSFCLDLLRQHFYRLDLDPAFRIADVTEAALLRTDVLEKMFEERYQSGDEPFIELVDAYGGTHDDSHLQEIILQLDNFASSHPDPAGWLSNLPELLGDTEARETWLRELSLLAQNRLAQARACLQRALGIAGLPDGPAQYLDLLCSELQQVESVMDGAVSEWDELRRQTQMIGFERLPSKRGGDIGLREQAKAARETAKGIIGKLSERLLAQTADELMAGLDAVQPAMSLLCRLTLDFRTRYGQAKQGKAIVDFNDLEHMALAVLREADQPSAIALELQQQYAEVLVDEYQDINGVQEALLQALADPSGQNNHLFMVGDVKQSIYRFRLADPTLFLRKYHDYGMHPSHGQRIDLAHNFRSRPSVLHAVNYLFRQLMTERVGELAYDEAAELQPGASYPGSEYAATPQAEVMLIERNAIGGAPNAEDEDDALADLGSTEREGRLIGLEIRRLVEDSGLQVWDKRQQKYRDVAYRDIVILLRATAGRANIFLEQLRQLDVPAYAELGTGYFQTTEVQTMQSLLQVIDNPRQDIPLAAVLRSPLVGLGGSDLVDIRLAAPGLSFYDALLASSRLEGSLGEKISGWLSDLTRWREQSRRTSLSELIWQIYRDTGYYTLVGAMPGGAERQANLRALHDRARQYEQTSFRGLFRFLRFIERLQAEQGDLGTARALGENENVVRIMSVHKSKGLEFPVVFMGGLGNKFNLLDLRRDLLIHKHLGLGPLAVDFERRMRYPTLTRLVIEQQVLLETLSEELRVLYVALTRAREKLYLVGSQRNLPQAAARWAVAASLPRGRRGALPEDMLAEGRCYLDWLGPALMGHTDAVAWLGTMGVEPPAVLRESGSSCWRFSTRDGAGVTAEPDRAQSGEELVAVTERRVLPDYGFADAVAARLGWNYPHAALRGKHVKVSVSELKRRYEALDEEAAPFERWQRPAVRRPAFVQQTSISAAELGSALHLLLQHVDLQQPPTTAYLEQLRARMQEQLLLNEEQAAGIDLELVRGFLDSDLGCRLRQAERVWRELPFSLRLDAAELYGAECAGEYVFVQGIVDCIWREGQNVVLIDFKSDQVTEENLAIVANRYRVQLDLYPRATEELFGLPVTERYLYFLRLGQAVKM